MGWARIVSLRRTLVLTGLVATAHCGGETGGGTNSGATGGRSGATGGSSSTGASGGATASSGGAAVATGGTANTPGLVACNDGTGRVDCCPPSARSDSPCNPDETPSCSRGCNNGYSSNLYCGGDGKWVAGKGLFPCGVDASAPSGPEACKAAGGECLLGPALGCEAVAVSIDCNPDRNPGGAVCCLERAPVCDDGGTHTISVADYDTSCKSNDDCVAVGEGDACNGVCTLVCAGSAINRKDEARYRAALASIAPDPPPLCGCPASFGPCCLNGHCSSSWQCQPPSP